MTVLALNGVCKSFVKNGIEVAPLTQLSVEIAAGEVAAVEGPSGAGKTTLLLVAGGLLAPDAGHIKLLGRDDFPTANLGDSDKVKVGDWAYAMGNPFLLATDFQPTVTYGIVSGVHRYQYPAGQDFHSAKRHCRVVKEA